MKKRKERSCMQGKKRGKGEKEKRKKERIRGEERELVRVVGT